MYLNCITRIVFVTAIIFITHINVFASQVRVDSIGFRGLVPDEETDLYYNPAYINFVEGNRIYGGIDFEYSRGEEVFGKTVNSTKKEYNVVPSIGCVLPIADYMKIGLVYRYASGRSTEQDISPDEIDNISYEDYYLDNTKTKSKSSSPINGTIFYGASVTPELDFGYSISYYSDTDSYESKRNYQHKISHTEYIAGYKNNYDYSRLNGNIGFIIKSGSDNRYGFVLFASSRKFSGKSEINEIYNTYMVEKKNESYNTGASFQPELKLDDKILFRANISLYYNWAEPEFDYGKDSSERKFDVKDTGFYPGLSAGINYNSTPDTLWVFGIDSFGSFSKSSYKEDTDITTPDYTSVKESYSWQRIEARIGLEKEIISKTMVLRCYISPLSFDYWKNTSKSNDDSGFYKDYTISGPVYSYSLGIGWTPVENLLFDVNFSQITSNYSKEETEFDDYLKYENKEYGYKMNFNVTYKF